jgi:hypothetical protein
MKAVYTNDLKNAHVILPRILQKYFQNLVCINRSSGGCPSSIVRITDMSMATSASQNATGSNRTKYKGNEIMLRPLKSQSFKQDGYQNTREGKHPPILYSYSPQPTLIKTILKISRI